MNCGLQLAHGEDGVEGLGWVAKYMAGVGDFNDLFDRGARALRGKQKGPENRGLPCWGDENAASTAVL